MDEALVVVDMVSTYEHEDGAVCAREVGARLDAMVARLERARRDSVPVVYVNDHYDRWDGSRERLVEWVLEQTPDRGLVEPLLPAPEDVFIVKARHSIFYETPLGYLLRSKDIETLTLLGQVTEQCVLYSALDAYVRDFARMYPRERSTYGFWPFGAAYMGIHDDDGALTDYSASNVARRVAELEAWNGALDAVEARAATEDNHIDLATLRWVRDAELFALREIQPHRRRPMHYNDTLNVSLYLRRNYAPLDDRLRAMLRHDPDVVDRAARRRGDLRKGPALCRGDCRLKDDCTKPHAHGVRVDKVDVHVADQLLPRDRGRIERAGETRGDVDGDNVLACRQGAVRGEEAVDRRLARARQLRRNDQALVELLRADVHAIEQFFLAEDERERHDRDAVAADQLWGKVRGRIGNDANSHKCSSAYSGEYKA